MDREGLVFLAKLAEQAERYDEMKEHVTVLASSATTELSIEERNLLSVAYKNATGMRRASWRIVSAVQAQRAKSLGDFPELSKSLRVTIEAELTAICVGLMETIDQKLMPLATSAESKIFYMKMKGDYSRYMAEYATDSTTRERLAAEALSNYQQAYDTATAEIPPTHYLRLGLALNFSVFHYDILNDVATACKMAKQAFDDAIAELDTLTDDSYRDSTLVMQLLRDNVTLWTSVDTEDEVDDALGGPAAAVGGA